MSSAVHALILAPPPSAPRLVITGLTLGERARRVAVRAGIDATRVHMVDSPEALASAARVIGESPLVVIRATDHVVAAQLVEPLEPNAPGSRVAVDPADHGAYAGALRVDARYTAQVLAALATDFTAGDRTAQVLLPDARKIEINRRARFACRTTADIPAATAWQFELVHKPMDAFMTRKFWRPLARPFTKIFLRLPFTPNHISIGTMVLGIIGCVIAAGPSYWHHLIGMTILFISAVGDNLDGEVARLRLESSKAGAWLDAIGDDVARVATLLGVGLHVAHRYPEWPLTAVTWGALAATALTMGLIYWYCIFVIHSSNNQDYTKALGVGPGVATGKRGLVQKAGDLASQIVRRDFIDLFVLLTAVIALPEISFVGLVLGAVIGLGVVIPTHLKIVQNRRRERATAAQA